MPESLPQGMDRIEELVARLPSAPDANFRDDALALVQLLFDLHRQGLANDGNRRPDRTLGIRNGDATRR